MCMCVCAHVCVCGRELGVHLVPALRKQRLAGFSKFNNLIMRTCLKTKAEHYPTYSLTLKNKPKNNLKR